MLSRFFRQSMITSEFLVLFPLRLLCPCFQLIRLVRFQLWTTGCFQLAFQDELGHYGRCSFSTAPWIANSDALNKMTYFLRDGDALTVSRAVNQAAFKNRKLQACHECLDQILIYIIHPSIFYTCFIHSWVAEYHLSYIFKHANRSTVVQCLCIYVELSID